MPQLPHSYSKEFGISQKFHNWKKEEPLSLWQCQEDQYVIHEKCVLYVYTCMTVWAVEEVMLLWCIRQREVPTFSCSLDHLLESLRASGNIIWKPIYNSASGPGRKQESLLGSVWPGPYGKKKKSSESMNHKPLFHMWLGFEFTQPTSWSWNSHTKQIALKDDARLITHLEWLTEATAKPSMQIE